MTANTLTIGFGLSGVLAGLGLFMVIAGGGLIWAVRGKEETFAETPREPVSV